MKKQDLESPELLDDILEGTEKLIEILGYEYQNGWKKTRFCVIGRWTFDVQCSMFILRAVSGSRCLSIMEKEL
ncbi:MAG: hypothetical protein MUO68_02965 [Desulfobacteraceae bacterium]|jgi:hypothetical protein|nr:hypothetical protein [Desulfobacteraceae bacterium]